MIGQFPHSGTVYTPDALAFAMARALGDTPHAAWLDPCVGHGAFPRGLHRLGVPRARIAALDLDPRDVEADKLAQLVRGVDFVDWSEHTRLRFDRIIANPPYVPLARLDPHLQAAALRLEQPTGEPLPLKANYWTAFLLACLRVLAPGGALAAVLPAAWDYARYASQVRRDLPRLFGSFCVYRSLKPLFGDVQEGSVVVVAHDFGAATGTSSRIEAPSGAELLPTLESAGGARRGVVVRTSFLTPPNTTKSRLLGEVMEVHLGGVTGDAQFFLLSETERLELGLPTSALRPALTRARHLNTPVMDESGWRALRAEDERVWLFYPSAGALREPRVQRYLRRRASTGGCRRDAVKVSSRTPWYRTPLPSRVDGFLSGMSRRGPFLVLRSMPRLTATNTLYVVRFREQTTLEQRAAWGLALLCTSVRRQLAARGRLYADGLTKIEPGDLLGVEVPEPPLARQALSEFRRATKLVIDGQAEDASRLADAWMLGPNSERCETPRDASARTRRFSSALVRSAQ